jgi:hypothetical protein
MRQRTQARQNGENEEAPFGVRYQVDGRRLLLYRSGSGGPAVVFLPCGCRKCMLPGHMRRGGHRVSARAWRLVAVCTRAAV